MKEIRKLLATTLVALIASPVLAAPAGPSEDCVDLNGGFARINVRPVREGGATAIEFHERGLTLIPVAKTGYPFTFMGSNGPCYKNGLVPEKDQHGNQVYLGVIPTTGEVKGIANCDNELRAPSLPPVFPPRGEKGDAGPAGSNGENGRNGLPGRNGKGMSTGAKVLIWTGAILAGFGGGYLAYKSLNKHHTGHVTCASCPR